MPKFPNIEVQLSGEDGNAFSIMGRVTKAMSGDYDNLIQVTMNTVEVL